MHSGRLSPLNEAVAAVAARHRDEELQRQTLGLPRCLANKDLCSPSFPLSAYGALTLSALTLSARPRVREAAPFFHSGMRVPPRTCLTSAQPSPLCTGVGGAMLHCVAMVTAPFFFLPSFWPKEQKINVDPLR